MEKLDSLRKIIIATGQINYMAVSIDSVNEQIKMTGLSKNPIHSEGVQEKDELLDSVVKKLADIMEEMGNLINSHDCICAIDERVTKSAFQIVVLGMDETDKDYEED